MSFWSGMWSLIFACEITSEMLIGTRQAVRCQTIARTASAQGKYHLCVVERGGGRAESFFCNLKLLLVAVV